VFVARFDEVVEHVLALAVLLEAFLFELFFFKPSAGNALVDEVVVFFDGGGEVPLQEGVETSGFEPDPRS